MSSPTSRLFSRLGLSPEPANYQGEDAHVYRFGSYRVNVYARKTMGRRRFQVVDFRGHSRWYVSAPKAIRSISGDGLRFLNSKKVLLFVVRLDVRDGYIPVICYTGYPKRHIGPVVGCTIGNQDGVILLMAAWLRSAPADRGAFLDWLQENLPDGCAANLSMHRPEAIP